MTVSNAISTIAKRMIPVMIPINGQNEAVWRRYYLIAQNRYGALDLGYFSGRTQFEALARCRAQWRGKLANVRLIVGHVVDREPRQARGWLAAA